jgi:hypothetical protein
LQRERADALELALRTGGGPLVRAARRLRARLR